MFHAKKVATYSGLVTLTTGSQAYSAVQISGNVVDYNIDLPTSQSFDIDGDGNSDFRIQATYGYTNSPSVVALNNGQFAINAGSSYSIGGFGFPGVNDVPVAATIDVANVNGPSPGQAIVMGNLGTGLVPNGTSFLYGTLERAGQDHLFWIELDISDNTEYGNPNVNFLRAAAWNDIPTSSAGGETLETVAAIPESSTAALLVLGAAGAVRRRRRAS